MKTTKYNNSKHLITVSEVAERLQKSPLTITRWIKEGRIRAKKVGRSWRISESDFETFLSRSLGRFSRQFDDALSDNSLLDSPEARKWQKIVRTFFEELQNYVRIDQEIDAQETEDISHDLGLLSNRMKSLIRLKELARDNIELTWGVIDIFSSELIDTQKRLLDTEKILRKRR